MEGGDKMAAIQKSVDSSSLAEVIDRILDKGVVIDVWARVSLVGIELLTIDARIVIASVDTWLKYAYAVGLLKERHHQHDGDGAGLEAAL
jgi:gas vesicle structural protein